MDIGVQVKWTDGGIGMQMHARTAHTHHHIHTSHIKAAKDPA